MALQLWFVSVQGIVLRFFPAELEFQQEYKEDQGGFHSSGWGSEVQSFSYEIFIIIFKGKHKFCHGLRRNKVGLQGILMIYF